MRTEKALAMSSLQTTSFRAPSGAHLDFTRLGFGGTSLGAPSDRQSQEDAAALVDAAWSLGFRYFDTAPLYGMGRSERRLGRALAARARDEFLLSTKVGRILDEGSESWIDSGAGPSSWPFKYDYSYDAVMRSFESSLRRLALDRIDILFVHDIDARAHGGRAGAEARTQELIERGGWRALDSLRASGAVRALGVGVNEWEPCARMLELADPDLFLLAGRYTLLEQEPLNALFPACRKRGVGVIIGAALNAGVLVGGPLYDHAPAPVSVKARVAAIAQVCAAHGTHVLPAALQFAAAHPCVVSVLTGAATPAELRQNAGAFLGAAAPAALWRALKTERLLHPDAPTPNRW